MKAKSAKLTDRLRELASGGGLAIAFSGGLDSLVLVQFCRKLGLDVLAVHAIGPQFAQAHSREAVNWLKKSGIHFKIAEHQALDIPDVRASHPLRCYYCKTALIGALHEVAESRALCDGTQAGDLIGYRPGLDALAEQKVASPFAETGFDKRQIKKLAAAFHFDLPHSNGQNCLLTRFEYGCAVQEAELRVIEAVEEDIAGHLAVPFRLRYLKSGPELHIESASPLPAELEAKLRRVLARRGIVKTPLRFMPKVSGFFDLSF